MRKTYAYNSIFLAFIIGIAIYVSTENTVLTVIAFLGIAIGGFILIRVLENLLYKGVDKAVDKAADAIKKRKEKKNGEQ